jgi:hypothetical protein
MEVLMVLSREWQDRGRAHPLDVGQVYDVPDVVGAALIAEGAARLPSDEDRLVRPPETKPMAPPETKGPRKHP